MNRLWHITRIAFLALLPTLLVPGNFAHGDCPEHAHEHDHEHHREHDTENDSDDSDAPCGQCVAQAEHASPVDAFPTGQQVLIRSHDSIFGMDQALLSWLDQETHSQRGPPAN